MSPAAVTAQTTANAELRQVMLNFTRVREVTARFVERKELKMLKEPLLASGTLIYVAPDHLEKLTTSPQEERMVIDRDRLTMEQALSDRVRSLSLREHPEIAALVDGIRATLAGDLDILTRLYKIEFAGNASDWNLSLQPKEDRLRQFVQEMRITGGSRGILRVETREGDGDRSDMRILDESVK